MKNKIFYLIIVVQFIVFLVIINLPRVIENSGKNNYNNVIVDKKYLEMFNSRFLEHEGTGLKAADIKVLVTVIESSNSNNQTFKTGIDPSSINGGVEPNAEMQEFTKYQSMIKSSSLYTVHFLYDKKTGFINSVIITEDKSP